MDYTEAIFQFKDDVPADNMNFHLLRLCLLISSSLLATAADQSVSYFSWFPATEHKTITFIPSMVYERAEEMCNKMRGRLLTFNWGELVSIISDLSVIHGQTDYWIGLTKEFGMVHWSDGTYYHPSSGFNITFSSDMGQQRSCALLQVMNGNNNYLIQMTSCDLNKKAICESWNPIGLFGILSITALGLSVICLIIVCVIVVRSFMANKNTTYVMKTSGREVASDK